MGCGHGGQLQTAWIPNGSGGGVAMGKLWPFGNMTAQTFRNPENIEPLTLEKLFVHYKKETKLCFKCGFPMVPELGNVNSINDLKPLTQL